MNLYIYTVGLGVLFCRCLDEIFDVLFYSKFIWKFASSIICLLSIHKYELWGKGRR